MSRRAALSLCCWLTLLATPSLAQNTSWDFTTADLARLSGEISYADDSAWFPKRLRENLTATIRWALDPDRDPAVTEGINTRDFFHGHVVCRKPCGADLGAKLRAYIRARNDLLAGALGGDPFGQVTDDNRSSYTEALREVEQLAAALLDWLCLRPNGSCGAIYHTFEYNAPITMLPSDPRRALIMMFGDTEPANLVLPPVPAGKYEAGVNSYHYSYCSPLHFVFLLDAEGVIHVRPGGPRELSDITE